MSGVSDSTLMADRLLGAHLSNSLLPSIRCMLASAVDDIEAAEWAESHVAQLGAIYACMHLIIR